MKDAPRITLREIDTEHLEDLDDNPEAVQFTVRLSGTPPSGWLDEFETAYRDISSPIKPPVAVEGDALRVTFLPRYAASLQDFVTLLGQVTARANDEWRFTQEMHESSAQEQRRAQMREALKRVTLPS